MVKNRSILEMLTALTYNPAKKDQQLKALDALLRADLNDVSTFRQNLIANKDVFLNADDPTLFTGAVDNDEFLNLEGDAHTNLTVLQQKAAEKRVLFGLEGMSLGQLKDILAPGSEVLLRETLTAQSPALGWRVSDDFLTVMALSTIITKAKQLAFNQLGVKLLEVKETNKEVTATIRSAIVAENVTKVEAALKIRSKESAALNDYITRNDFKLSDSELGSLQIRLDQIRQEIGVMQQQEQTAILALFNEKYALYNTEKEDMTFVNQENAALNKKRIDKVAQHYSVITPIFQLAQLLVIDDSILDNINEKYANVRRLQIMSAINYNVQIVEEHTASMQQNLVEIARLANLPIENLTTRKRLLGKAESSLRLAKKTLVDRPKADSWRTENLFADEFNEEIEAKYAKIKLKFNQAENQMVDARIMLYGKAAIPDYGNIYTTKTVFTNKVVKGGATYNDNVGVVLERRFGDPTKTTIKMENLDPGDQLYSSIAFSRPSHRFGMPATKVIGQLVQDHTGKVTNITTDELSDEEQLKVAFQQAEMMLSNFKTGSGVITIRGDAAYVKDARYVLVALIYLQTEKYPQLEDVKIVSWVVGCNVPNGSGLLNTLRGGLLKECIRDNEIPANLMPKIQEMGNELIRHGKHFTERQQKLKEKNCSLRDNTLSEEQKLVLIEEIKNSGFKEDEEIDIDSEGKIAARRPVN